MNHQLAEEWLFTDEKLTIEQKKELDAHLAECATCRQLAQAWLATENLLKSTSRMSPAPNFTQRWQGRLAEERARRLRHLNWILLLTFSLTALVLLVILGIQQFSILKVGPTVILTNLILEATSFITYFRGLGLFIGDAFKFLPFAVPLILWINLAISFVLLSLIWILTIWRLPHIKGVRNEA